jgi:hypothetical protein
MEVANTPAYHDAATIMTVKRFIVQVPLNKLQCFFTFTFLQRKNASTYDQHKPCHKFTE